MDFMPGTDDSLPGTVSGQMTLIVYRLLHFSEKGRANTYYG